MFLQEMGNCFCNCGGPYGCKWNCYVLANNPGHEVNNWVDWTFHSLIVTFFVK